MDVVAGGKNKGQASAKSGEHLHRCAAVVLTEWMNSRDTVAGHMDVMLADRLSQRAPGLEALAVHASFVSPSRGGFQEHTSGCEKNLLRTEQWSDGEPWFFPRPGMKEIWLCKRGSPSWSNDCHLGKLDTDLTRCT